MKNKKINPGAVIDTPGNSAIAKKVSYRNSGPVTDYKKCIKCAKCWMYCPDIAFRKNSQGFFENIEKYCKGCGLCARVCPQKCIKMVEVGK
jgi:pyruvate ferredoxin oxidoreductase delta subunit